MYLFTERVAYWNLEDIILFGNNVVEIKFCYDINEDFNEDISSDWYKIQPKEVDFEVKENISCQNVKITIKMSPKSKNTFPIKRFFCLKPYFASIYIWFVAAITSYQIEFIELIKIYYKDKTEFYSQNRNY